MATGILAAIYEKKLNSEIGFRWILKKIALLCIVVLAHELEVVVGVGGIRDLAVGFYIANEGISILENCAKMNVPVARNLSNILEQLKDKLDNEDEELFKMGIVNGKTEERFMPNEPITRGEVAVLIRRAIKFITGK